MSTLDNIENSSTRTINDYFRANDESHKWPICGKFNVTELAIRRLRKQRTYAGGRGQYFLALDREISSIVNSAV
jgi:hypothetical protein